MKNKALNRLLTILFYGDIDLEEESLIKIIYVNYENVIYQRNSYVR
jgi:hypothetical protein